MLNLFTAQTLPYLCRLFFKNVTKEIQLAVDKGEMLPLMEEFYTIQGEGYYYTGTIAYFIRVGGCDVGCHWCDVKESWNADLHPPTAIEHIVTNAKKYAETVVVTGGEPLSWNMLPLTTELKDKTSIFILKHQELMKLLESGIGFVYLQKTKLPTQSAYDIANELKS